MDILINKHNDEIVKMDKEYQSHIMKLTKEHENKFIKNENELKYTIKKF